MLKVKVIDLPVFYDGKRYLKDEELVIEVDHFNESLFELLEEVEKISTQDELLEKFYKNNTADKFKEILTENEIDFEEINDKKKLFELILDSEIDVLTD